MPAPIEEAPSFIPHESRRSRGRYNTSGILIGFSFLAFLVSVGLAGGVFFYSRFLDASLDSKKGEVAEVQKTLDVQGAEELVRLSKRLSLSEELLKKHIAVTPFFEELEQVTLPSIRFTTIDLTTTEKETKVTLMGEARGYPAIALQSDAFSDNRFFKNPVFSNFKEGDENRVSFTLTFDVDKSVFAFINTI